ncbi:MAG: 2-hydroxyacyl-CoA dehydratase [Actinobacteria bacterium]|nr:2-hydroxyacyl-CoA dehydratase [Actinomycetota bacterium]MDI6831324.1 2-hydroxyacyl-CoA dehydratase [Actinomycetota bacterium]
MGKIGITTTVPIEVIYAAGHVPVDLNNVFVSHPRYRSLVERAEEAGFPRSFCAWIKGIYGVVEEMGDLDAVVAVTQGDCSNTHGLMETLQSEGMEVIPFAYPYDRDYELLRLQMEVFARRLGAGEAAVEKATERLDLVRARAHRVDELTWREGLVTGFENHLYLVSCSDMGGDPDAFRGGLEAFIAKAEERVGDAGFARAGEMVRLGYVGVPPMAPSLYDYLETLGARVVYNETQRQFSLPFATRDLVEKYLLYSYPYSIFYRLEDIRRETERRRLAGIIHYVQSFCFRQVEDIILRRSLAVPILTLELDRETELDARARVRLESFVEMLR